MRPIPNKLLMAIARGDAVAFVGSGPSMASGFPSWSKLLELMLAFCTTNGIVVPDQSDISHLISTKKFLLAAEAVRANMGDEKWFECLGEIFDQPSASLTEFHHLLAKIPFAAAATTNYETLVERAFRDSKPDEPIRVFTQTDHAQLGTALNSKEFFVLKAHGTIERPDTIVLTQNDYAVLIHNSAGYRMFLKALFLDRTILFLGFGLNDPELCLLLEELSEVFDGSTPTHYAFFDISNTTATEQKNFESHYSIQVLPYTPSTPDHPEVLEFLTHLLGQLPKYILNHAMNAALKPAKEVLNSDSHYRLVMNSDNEFSIREKYPGASKDKPLNFTIGFEFDNTKESDREAHEALQRLFAEGEPVTITSPQVTKFVPPEILLPLMPDSITEMKVTIGNVKSDKTFVVRAIMEPANGPTATLDNIRLRKIQGGSKKALLSNEDQGMPWTVTLKIDFEQGQSDTQFRFHCVDIPIKQALKIEQFCDALSRGGYLTFEVEKNDEPFGRAKLEPGAFDPPNPNMIKILEALVAIQSKTGVTFASPQKVSRDEANYIMTVAQIVTNGTATMRPPELNFTVREVREIFPKLVNGTIAIQDYADDWVSVVLGKRVSLGPVLISCDKLRVTTEERERIMRTIEARSPNDVVSVVVTPIEGSVIEAKYVAWLPDPDADAVRNMPLVKTASLKNLIKLLFDSSVDSTGSFSDEEFMNLLTKAKAESANEEIVISPLLLATENDLAVAFDSILDNIEQEQRTTLKAKLLEHGWLRDEGQYP